MRNEHWLRSKVCLLAMFLVLLVGISPATAQDKLQADVSAGYANLNWYMHGWNAQVGTDVTRHWGVFFEVAGAYGTDCRECEERFRDLYVLGGSRWSWRPSHRLSLFAQTAAGGLHSRSQGYGYSLALLTGIEEFIQPPYSVNYFVVQPGGGVTTMVTRRVGIRTQFDVPLAMPSDGGDFWMSIFPRVSVGTLFRLGTVD